MNLLSLFKWRGSPLAIVSLLFALTLHAESFVVMSPDQQVKVEVSTVDGGLFYQLEHGADVVVNASELGLATNHGDLFGNFDSLKAQDQSHTISESYELSNGKQHTVQVEANQRRFWVTTDEGKVLELIFRVSNDGAAFRYHIPIQEANEGDRLWQISEEKTEFVLNENTVAWIQPMPKAQTGWSNTQPSYEELYVHGMPLEQLHGFLEEHDNEVEAAADLVAVYPYVGWIFPALFKMGDQSNPKWVLLSEAGVGRNYCGTRLVQEEAGNRFQIGFPMEAERVFDGPVKPESTLPWNTPWRLIVVGDTLATIVESTMGTDYAEPSTISDAEWVKPGRASWSWVGLKDESIRFDIQERYIRYAAEMGWDYTLIDVNWDHTIGYDRIRNLVEIGNELGIGILLWYNSSGPWNITEYTPKSALLSATSRNEEFERISSLGVKGVKIDFFPGDGQSVMNYYHDLFTSAAEYKLMVNTHGTTLPRGWQRTYPNLVTMESVRGMEFITFSQDNADQAPKHLATLPFTRNVFDPMDFTPMMFENPPGIKKHTLMGFELALPVLYQSGVQHLAETADGMAKQPDFVKKLLRNMPTVWDETKFIDGYPAKYAVVARRSGQFWYVAAINSLPESKAFYLELPNTDPGDIVEIYTDAMDENALSLTKGIVNESGKIEMTLKPNGGCVIRYSYCQ